MLSVQCKKNDLLFLDFLLINENSSQTDGMISAPALYKKHKNRGGVGIKYELHEQTCTLKRFST